MPAETSTQMSFHEIDPAGMNADEYLTERCRQAHAILSELYAVFEGRLPSNVTMAMTYLHVELVAINNRVRNGGTRAHDTASSAR